MLVVPLLGYARPMKDLFKMRNKTSSATQQSVSGGEGRKDVAPQGDVQNFLQKVASMPPATTTSSGDARLIFSLDATASRQSTWDVASQLQADMFVSAQALGGLNLQLCYFRGFGEFYRSDWQGDSNKLLRVMSGITCQAGATQLKKILRHAIDENARRKVRGVVFIGDAMEEGIDELADLAGKLGVLNVPLFMFQEGGDSHVRQAYKELCRLSGGAYSQFDAASADQLRDLLRAVAVYAAGGLKALTDFSQRSGNSVKLLQQQLKK